MFICSRQNHGFSGGRFMTSIFRIKWCSFFYVMILWYISRWCSQETSILNYLTDKDATEFHDGNWSSGIRVITYPPHGHHIKTRACISIPKLIFWDRIRAFRIRKWTDKLYLIWHVASHVISPLSSMLLTMN